MQFRSIHENTVRTRSIYVWLSAKKRQQRRQQQNAHLSCRSTESVWFRFIRDSIRFEVFFVFFFLCVLFSSVFSTFTMPLINQLLLLHLHTLLYLHEIHTVLVILLCLQLSLYTNQNEMLLFFSLFPLQFVRLIKNAFHQFDCHANFFFFLSIFRFRYFWYYD